MVSCNRVNGVSVSATSLVSAQSYCHERGGSQRCMFSSRQVFNTQHCYIADLGCVLTTVVLHSEICICFVLVHRPEQWRQTFLRPIYGFSDGLNVLTFLQTASFSFSWLLVMDFITVIVIAALTEKWFPINGAFSVFTDQAQYPGG